MPIHKFRLHPSAWVEWGTSWVGVPVLVAVDNSPVYDVWFVRDAPPDSCNHSWRSDMCTYHARQNALQFGTASL